VFDHYVAGQAAEAEPLADEPGQADEDQNKAR
jgi:hypothetical protein